MSLVTGGQRPGRVSWTSASDYTAPKRATRADQGEPVAICATPTRPSNRSPGPCARGDLAHLVTASGSTSGHRCEKAAYAARYQARPWLSS